jgi:hypothetical protein
VKLEYESMLVPLKQNDDTYVENDDEDENHCSTDDDFGGYYQKYGMGA